MIEKIVVDGFKSLQNTSIEIKPLTVFIGLNSSGKSSILQLLEVLKQTAMQRSSNLVITGGLVNLGAINDVISKRKGRKEMEIEIKGNRPISLYT